MAAGGSLVRAVSPAAVVSPTRTCRRRRARDARRGRQRRRRPRTRASSSTRTPPSTTAAGSAPSPTSPRASPSPATSPSVRARSSASAPASRPAGASVRGPPSAPARRSSATSLPARRSSASRRVRFARVAPLSDAPAHPRRVHRQPLPLAAGRGPAAPRPGRSGHRRRGRRRPGSPRPPALQPDRRLRRVAERARRRRRRAPQQARLASDDLRAADLILTMTGEQSEQVRRARPVRRRSRGRRCVPRRGRRRSLAGGRRRSPSGCVASPSEEAGADRHDAAYDIADPIGGPLRDYRAMGDEVRALVQALVDRWSGR